MQNSTIDRSNYTNKIFALTMRHPDLPEPWSAQPVEVRYSGELPVLGYQRLPSPVPLGEEPGCESIF